MTAEWRPATGLEQALLDAVTAGDREAYVAALSRIPLFTPVHPDGVSPLTAARHGRTYLMAYPSQAMLRAAFGGASPAYQEVSLEQLARAWPDPEWWLAVAPATPIEAYLPAAQLAPPPADEPAAGGTRLPTLAPSEFVPRNELEELLEAALDEDDSDTVLKLLLLAELVVPLPDGVPPGAAPGSPEFRWRRYEDGAGPCVPVFTAASRCDELLGPVPRTLAEGVSVVSAWPDPAVTLVLDPGTEVEVSLPGQAVVELAGWAAQLGMVEAMSEAAATEPVTDQLPPEPVPPVTAARTPEVVLQRPIAAEHVAHYLQRGYDVISGWAHRADGAAGADANAAALGTAPGEPAVHVIRWVWSGPGPYAPAGPAQQVRVTAARVPHGAQLRRLDRTGADRVIASYDADRRQWRPAGDGS